MMKLNKKTIGALIFVFLLLLLFFSKTIYTYNMPQVTGTKPKRGALSKLEISSGIASWAETETVYAVSGGAAGQIFVREGDKVEKGQVLFEMSFDVEAVQRRFAETANNIAKLETEIRNLRLRLNNIREALAEETAAETGTESSGAEKPVSILSGQAGLITMEFDRARLALRNAQFSFELGILSRNELVNTENNLKALFYKYQAEAEELEHTLAIKYMDLENLRLSQETIRKILGDYRNNAVIIAPSSGIILGLAAERGKYFPENAFLVSIGVGREFTVECSVSLDNNFVSSGDTCELSNASHVLRGTVRQVKPAAQGKTVIIAVASDEIADGETFDITFEKNSAASFTLVPNSAINQDNDGYFLYLIKRRKGIMGEEYYLERLNIFTGDSDHQNTAVIRGITFFEPIVLTSNKALSAGLAVSLKNPEDFFEN
jgi:multidrug efflux pump subunit AcrA (membrane-fusion protein)